MIKRNVSEIAAHSQIMTMTDENTLEINSTVIVVLCGLPGAGKSTLVSHLSSYLEKLFVCHTVSYDDIQTEIEVEQKTNGFSPEAWKESRNTALKRVESLIINSQTSSLPVHRPNVILVDDNMYYRSMRKQMYQLACNYEIGFLQLYLSTPYDVCLARNSRRIERVPLCTMERMYAVFEPPSFSGDSWESKTLSIDFSDDSSTLSEILQRVSSAVEAASSKPKKNMKLQREELILQAEKSRKALTENVYHAADLCLRKHIGTVISSFSLFLRSNSQSVPKDVSLASISKQLSKEKTEILRDWKHESRLQTSTLDVLEEQQRILSLFDARTQDMYPFLRQITEFQ